MSSKPIEQGKVVKSILIPMRPPSRVERAAASITLGNFCLSTAKLTVTKLAMVVLVQHRNAFQVVKEAVFLTRDLRK